MSHTLPIRSRDETIFGGKKTEKKKDPPATPEIQAAIDNLSPSATAEEYKNVGNMCYSHSMFTAAIKYYTKAIEQEPTNHVHYSNRSAAYLNSILLSGPSMAIKDANKAIEINPTWFKGHLRKADALFVQDKLDDALACYNKVLELNPNCTAAMDSKRELQKQQLMNGSYVPPPEQAPYSSEQHRQDAASAEKPKRPTEPPKPEETDDLIKTWSKDTNMDTTATATKRYKASVQEADRELGRTIKEQMMQNFKKKLESDTEFRSKVNESLEADKLRGSGYNYKNGSDKKVYAKGTDEIGLAVSADCYNSYTYRDKVW